MTRIEALVWRCTVGSAGRAEAFVEVAVEVVTLGGWSACVARFCAWEMRCKWEKLRGRMREIEENIFGTSCLGHSPRFLCCCWRLFVHLGQDLVVT